MFSVTMSAGLTLTVLICQSITAINIIVDNLILRNNESVSPF